MSELIIIKKQTSRFGNNEIWDKINFLYKLIPNSRWNPIFQMINSENDYLVSTNSQQLLMIKHKMVKGIYNIFKVRTKFILHRNEEILYKYPDYNQLFYKNYEKSLLIELYIPDFKQSESSFFKSYSKLIKLLPGESAFDINYFKNLSGCRWNIYIPDDSMKPLICKTENDEKIAITMLIK